MLLQRGWRRPPLWRWKVSYAQIQTQSQQKLHDALKERWVNRPRATPISKTAPQTQPLLQDILNSLNPRDIETATTLLSDRNDIQDFHTALHHALLLPEDDASPVVAALLRHAIHNHQRLLSTEDFDACINLCSNSLHTSLASTLVSVLVHEIVPIPKASAATLVKTCLRSRAIDEAIWLYELYQEQRIRLPDNVSLLLACLLADQITGGSVITRRKRGADMSWYFLSDYMAMAPSVLELFQRKATVRPPSLLLNRLAKDLTDSKQSVVPLIEYALQMRLPLDATVFVKLLQLAHRDPTESMTATVEATTDLITQALRQATLDAGETSFATVMRKALTLCLQNGLVAQALELHALAPTWTSNNPEEDSILVWVMTTLSSLPPGPASPAVVDLWTSKRIPKEVALSLSTLLPTLPTTHLSSHVVTKLAQALCTHRAFSEALELLQWATPLDLVSSDSWTSFFNFAPRTVELVTPALVAYLSKASGDDIDTAVAAMTAALHVDHTDVAIDIYTRHGGQSATTWPLSMATLMQGLLAAANSPAKQKSLIDYFLGKDKAASTAAFEVLAGLDMAIPSKALQDMILHALHSHNMVAGYNMLRYAVTKAIPVAPYVFTVCFTEHSRTKHDAKVFIELFFTFTKLYLVEDNSIVYQAAISACMNTNNLNLAWKCAAVAETRGVVVGNTFLSRLDELSAARDD